ncbi:MAG TPA: nitroreductase [Allosphingosinicella sp.]|jgi:nitroreductase|nr:nitroreductase [Allosphingosinicella sp.]
MLNDLSSTLSLLATRRSGRPRDLVAPGPDADQLRRILEIGMRSPDHGKLAPWRFIHVAKARRDDFHALLEHAYRAGKEEEPGRLELEAVHRFAHQAPELIVLVSSPVEGTKIPQWEQELSCGAAGMNILLSTHAMGFAGGWVTGWAAYSEEVRRGLGLQGQERIAGFLYLGTPGVPLEERARPAFDDVVHEWAPGAGNVA